MMMALFFFRCLSFRFYLRDDEETKDDGNAKITDFLNQRACNMLDPYFRDRKLKTVDTL